MKIKGNLEHQWADKAVIIYISMKNSTWGLFCYGYNYDLADRFNWEDDFLAWI